MLKTVDLVQASCNEFTKFVEELERFEQHILHLILCLIIFFREDLNTRWFNQKQFLTTLSY